MANEYQDRIFPGLGQLNTDDNVWTLPQNHSRYRLNVSIDDDGDRQILTNSLGNSVVSNTDLSSSAKCIGYVEDIENKAGIHFIYDIVNGDRILRYNSITDTIDDIITSSDFDLNFSDTLIHANVIGTGDSKILAWTDGINPPRQVNISNAISTTVTEDEVSAIKAPPYDIRAEYGTNTTINTNNLSNNLFQFSVRYKYVGGSYSVFSEYITPFSEGFTEYFPNGNEFSPLEPNVSNKNNYIELTIYDIPANVEYIDICYRLMNISDDSGYATGDWLLYDSILRETSTENYFFYNDKSTTPIDNNFVSKQYDYVPILATTQETINGNIISYGGITEGYDNVVIPSGDVSLYNVYQSLTGGFTTNEETITDGSVSTTYANVSLNFSASVNRLYKVWLRFNSVDYFFSTYSSFYSNLTDLLTFFVNEIDDLSLTDFDAQIDTTPNPDELQVVNDSSNTGFLALDEYEAKDILPSFKQNSTVKLGILYQDDYNRSSFISVSDDTEIKIPSLSTNQSLFPYRSGIQYEIDFTAPSWATKWSWCMSTSNIPSFYRKSVFLWEVDQNFIEYDLTESNVSSVNGFDYNNSFSPYEFTPQKGDRVTIIGYSNSISSFIYDELYDYEIIEYNSTNNTIKTAYNGFLYDKPSDSFYVLFLEIYRPSLDKGNEESFYYQFGDFGLISSSGYHLRSEGQKIEESNFSSYAGTSFQDQNALNTCSSILNFGNCFCHETSPFYYKNNTSVITPSVFVFTESQSPFMGVDYRTYNEGKPYISNKSVKQTNTNSIRWGGVLNTQSGVNNLFSFESDDIKYLNEEYGDLYLMKQIGQTLKCYQEAKVSSFGLGISSYIDANNNVTTYTTQNVIDDIRLPIDNYGTIHPKSFILNDRNAYFFDVNQGVVVRDSANGFMPVSDYKMRTYFRNKAHQIKGNLSNYEVVGGYDYINEMYIISFIDLGTPSNSETVGFHEPTNRWISFYSFTPEFYGGIGGTQFISFKDGEVWTHNESSVNRNSFYGVQYNSYVWATSNQSPLELKDFGSMELGSNSVWSAPENDSIVIEPNATYPNGMASRIKEGRIRNREGIYEADFLRDGLTGGLPFDTDYLMNGRNLKGRELTIKLENDDTTEAKLFYVGVNGKVSK